MIYISTLWKKVRSLVLRVPLSAHLTSSTQTKSNLYLVNSLATVVFEPGLYRPLIFHVLFTGLCHTKELVHLHNRT
jgi:hypothetical protein